MKCDTGLGYINLVHIKVTQKKKSVTQKNKRVDRRSTTALSKGLPERLDTGGLIPTGSIRLVKGDLRWQLPQRTQFQVALMHDNSNKMI